MHILFQIRVHIQNPKSNRAITSLFCNRLQKTEQTVKKVILETHMKHHRNIHANSNYTTLAPLSNIYTHFTYKYDSSEIMEYSWKQRINTTQNHNRLYGRCKANAPCKKHPKHTQSPGVCSICLNEKLSHLNNAAPKKRASFASSSSSSYLSSLSSSYVSSYSSPVVNYTGSRAHKSTKISGQEVLKKSRSMAFFLQRRKDYEDENGNGNGKKIEIKRGFWSKLFPRRNKDLSLMHSTSMRERVVKAVHLR